MKNSLHIVLSLFLLFCIIPIQAQDSLFICKSGNIVYKNAIINIDSVNFSGTTTQYLNFYKSGLMIFQNKVSDIDSITFAKPKIKALAYIFDIKSIPETTIEVSTTEWNKLLNYFDQNPDNEEYVICNFSFNKNGFITFADSTGLRIRGNTSRRRPEGAKGEVHNAVSPDWHHAHFALKFNKYVKGTDIKGIEKINMKWFKDDAMYAREVYCYDLFERFGVWTSPQSSYSRLNIKIKEDPKTAYFGIYEMVEPIDEDYLKHRKDKFISTKGFLWKASWGADLVNTDKSRMGIENVTLTSVYTPVYDLKSNELYLDSAKNQLVDFMTNLNSKTGASFKTWLTSKMDVELFLKTYAVNVMCGMWDDYWGNKNNYYFYFDADGKFYFIPYDYDNTLGTSQIITNSGTQDLLNWGSSANPLVKKIISIPEYETLYKSYIKELANSNNDYFHFNKSSIRIKNWHDMIKGYISNDTGEDMTIVDNPASWGNCGFYRLLEADNNFFKIRGANIPQ